MTDEYYTYDPNLPRGGAPRTRATDPDNCYDNHTYMIMNARGQRNAHPGGQWIMDYQEQGTKVNGQWRGDGLWFGRHRPEGSILT